jgi:hypothetical protein
MRRQQLQQHRNKNRVFGQRTVNTDIVNREFRELLKRFPPLEEFPITKSPGQLPLEDDVLVAIPMGKKYYVWYTCDEGTDDACYLLELNGQRRIVSAKRVDQQNGTGKVEYSYGSVFLATAQNAVLFIEDVYYFQGRSMASLPYGTRLGYIYEFMKTQITSYSETPRRFFLPVHYSFSATSKPPPCDYPVYQTQIRSLTNISEPHRIHHASDFEKNTEITIESLSSSTSTSQSKTFASASASASASIVSPDAAAQPVFIFRPQFRKPAYKSTAPCVFAVTPDEEYDVYHLHAYRNPQEPRVKIGVAGIPSLKLSALMNGFFRKIRENDNIDYVEESEDEADFEEGVYTHADKVILMECFFDAKTKKWVPHRAVSPRTRLTPIYNL